jgi:DNA modification methylase
MPDITLTESEAQTLARCLSEHSEPPADLAAKLFPTVHAKFDFRTLNNARIPTIEYAGKRPEAAILNEASAFGAGSPLQVVRFFQGGKLKKSADQMELFAREGGETYETGWKNLIVQGDNLQFLKTCFINQDPIIKDKVKGKVKLVYIDPPFATKTDFAGKSGETSYADKIDRAEFIEALRERLIFLKEVMANDATIYVHLDTKMVHYVKVVMDELLGQYNLINVITWQRSHAHGDTGQGAKHFGRVTEQILAYSKSEQFTFIPKYVPYTEDIKDRDYKYTDSKTGEIYRLMPVDGPGGASKGNPHYEFHGVTGYWRYSKVRMQELYDAGEIVVSSTGKSLQRKKYLKDAKGTPVTDLWLDVGRISPTSTERVEYPTQKPESLLERILETSSVRGDLVMDIFGGSGTTAAVAEKLGRRWITCDFGKHAIYTIQSRIATLAESQKLGLTPEQSKKKIKYDKAPKDFGVVSVGAFDFSRIMDLRKNKDAYVAFVLGIFGITERGEHFAKKYHISNVIAEKDGHPVEVYPVWEDKWLKEVRIDEDYLKGIVKQANGKLKGTYYIIAPQACTRVGELTLPNGKGDKVTFKTMSFPYKILEDAARHFQLSEQPDSPENINRLISSVGFYFNETVEFKVKKTGKGFKVATFKTTITDTNEKAFDGLDGLAMVLVDTDYDGETFKVDSCFYQKDLKEGEVVLKDVSNKTALIAVDKHGNESQIVTVK